MSVVHEIAGCPEMADVLLWDAHERCWVIGHRRWMRDIEQDYFMAVPVKDADELITDGEPVPVLARSTHWAALPQPVCDA